MSGVRVPHDELQQFACDVLCSAGVDPQEAPIIAHVMVWFDLIGRSTQGLWRLPIYLKRFSYGLIRSPCNPQFDQKSETIYLLNGRDGFGHYLSHLGMSKAIYTASQFGVGLVGVHHSNHFGAAAYYVQMAAQNSKIGLAFSNAVPRVAPYGGVTPALGTNPLAFGAPTRNGQSVLVDLSTGASAGSVVRKAVEEQQNIPEGILIDENGNSIIDPKEAARGVIAPFGGAKGFCLGLMVEILSGIITGAGVAHEVASLQKNFERSSNSGHLFMAIDIPTLIPIEDYNDRLDTLLSFIKGTDKKAGTDEIRIPGETRWRNYAKQSKEGITLDRRTVESLDVTAHEFSVDTPW